jgi:hypothetical protein
MKPHATCIGLCTVLFLSTAACSGGDDSPSNSQDSGAGGDSGGSSCDPVTPAGEIIHKDHDAGAPPTMTGGTIADGVYALTQMVQYNGEDGDTAHKDTFVFSGGAGQIAGLEDGTGTQMNAFFTYTTSGNDLDLTLTCGASGMVTMKYTATGTTITTVNADDANELHTFTKM